MIKRLLLLAQVFVSRATNGWLPFQPKPGKVSFANIGEGAFDMGRKTYFADATAVYSPGVHYLVYKISASPPTGYNAADCCTPCTAATDIPLGSSDDAPDFTGMPTTINLFGAVPGTVRVITDGTIANGNLVMVQSAAVTSQGVSVQGACTVYVASGSNICLGRAIIGSDCTTAAGDVITIIPDLPIGHSSL